MPRQRETLRADELVLIADLVAALHTPRFCEAFHELVNSRISFDISCIYAYSKGLHPVLLHDGFGNAVPKPVLTNYLRGTYVLDPIFRACELQVVDGLYRTTDLERRDTSRERSGSIEGIRPCVSMHSGAISEELALFCRIGAESYVVYSVMRKKGTSEFSPSEMRALDQISPLLRSFLGQHWSGYCGAPTADGTTIWVKKNKIAQGLSGFGRDLLTAREKVVVELLLAGASTVDAADRLGIADGTVKNHKKNIYNKLGVRSRSQLFHAFMQTLAFP